MQPSTALAVTTLVLALAAGPLRPAPAQAQGPVQQLVETLVGAATQVANASLGLCPQLPSTFSACGVSVSLPVSSSLTLP